MASQNDDHKRPILTGHGSGETVRRSRVEGGWRNVLINLGLAMGSLLAVLLLCELLLFRFVLIPSDVPANIYLDRLVRLTPGAEGVWRVGADVAGPFRINAQGWNSGHASYSAGPPRQGVKRIAIIGDSFVEALQVPFDASLAERLEHAAGGGLQVYRFGISGAPLSHYLYMARQVAHLYRPDMIVLVLVHNDFDESFLSVAGRYTSSFQKFTVANGQVVAETPPAPYRPTWRDWLRQTATLRYLYYRQKLDPSALIAKVFPGAPQIYQANVALSALAAHRAAIEGATAYAFAQFRALAQEQNFHPLLIMDGDRQSIYLGADPGMLRKDGALWLNEMAGKAAAREGLALIDMHALFEADWRQNQQKFEFRMDNHWNERGHQLAADAIRAYLNENPL